MYAIDKVHQVGYVMLCYVMLCYVMLCYVRDSCVLSLPVVLWPLLLVLEKFDCGPDDEDGET